MLILNKVVVFAYEQNKLDLPNNMKTPAGRECPHFYGNYFRGRNVEECRLLKLNGQIWSRDLCKSCPVPDIARANSCQHMQLRAAVSRSIADTLSTPGASKRIL